MVMTFMVSVTEPIYIANKTLVLLQKNPYIYNFYTLTPSYIHRQLFMILNELQGVMLPLLRNIVFSLAVLISSSYIFFPIIIINSSFVMLMGWMLRCASQTPAALFIIQIIISISMQCSESNEYSGQVSTCSLSRVGFLCMPSSFNWSRKSPEYMTFI